MATRKITITVDDEQLAEVRRLVAAGRAASISGFVKHAISVAVNDAAGWEQMLREGLQESGGPLSAQERAWADGLLSSETAKNRSGRRRPA